MFRLSQLFVEVSLVHLGMLLDMSDSGRLKTVLRVEKMVSFLWESSEDLVFAVPCPPLLELSGSPKVFTYSLMMRISPVSPIIGISLTVIVSQLVEEFIDLDVCGNTISNQTSMTRSKPTISISRKDSLPNVSVSPRPILAVVNHPWWFGFMPTNPWWVHFHCS